MTGRRPVPPARGWSLSRWAAASCGAVVVAGLAGAAIERRHAPSDLPPSVASPPADRAARSTAPRIGAPQFDLTIFDEAPTVHAQRTIKRAVARADEYALELQLLRPAREALARDDFATVLAATAEHVRRFPRGELSEERDALRILALVGAKREPEARRSAAAFRARFPRSLLLRRVDAAVGAAP